MSRRTLLRWTGTAGVLAVTVPVVASCSPPASEPGEDANGLILLPGFTSRLIAVAGEPVADTDVVFRAFPDGAASYIDEEVPGGWYVAVNHEIPLVGGVTSIRFAPDGTITDALVIAKDTSINCAGGKTPWGTWLTCEEFDWGHVWECDPTGAKAAVMRPAMGAFAHEAAAVGPDDRIYLTEDRPNGAFYRFTPTTPGDLSSGLLEVATGPAPTGSITWAEVPNPNPNPFQTACRRQVSGTIEYDGGEGIATLGNLVWFTTKGDDRIWQYDIATSTMSIRYQAGEPSPLSGVDNLIVDEASGALFVAEDGDNMEVVMLQPDDTALPVVRFVGHDASEVTGLCFSPDGQRLYFGSQRAPIGAIRAPGGATYEITGPFDELLGR